jgi:general transcription factor 3C polypeptide 3 (transcription factor C subunit 4)
MPRSSQPRLDDSHGNEGQRSSQYTGQEEHQYVHSSVTGVAAQPSFTQPPFPPQMRQAPPVSSYYIDPLLVADDGNRNILPKNLWNEQINAAAKRKAEQDPREVRLHKTTRNDYIAFPDIETAQELSRSNYPALSNTTSSSHQQEFISSMPPDRNAMDSSTDALLQRQLDLQDASDNESESESRQRHLSRYSDEDDDDPRRSRRGRGRRRPARGKGVKRGPRKAAEPTGDVKYRINMASEAYMNGRLDEAIEWVEDAIRINAETYRAWTLLASLLEEKGDLKGSFTARIFSCHLQPKHVEGWLHCAEIGIALRDELPDEASVLLEQSSVCYSAALRADINNRQARHGRAAIAVERRQYRTAAKDYLYLLERGEYDVHALRSYAEMTILLASTGKRNYYKPESAIEWYQRAFTYFRNNGIDDRYALEWQDVDIFAGLMAYIGQTKDALYELKTLARWLLGRQDEDFWDDWQDDDREWDVDNLRRLGFGEYQEGKYLESSYGSGLPLELRTKLAVYRLKLGDVDEAEVSRSPVLEVPIV